MTRHASPAEAVACVQSGHRVFIHGAAATPTFLVAQALIQIAHPGDRDGLARAWREMAVCD